MEVKICSKCGIEKPINEFHKSIYHKSGFKSQCKECKRIEYQTSKGLSHNEALKYINEINQEKQLLKSGYKICPKCKIKKLISEFKKNEDRKDGLDYWCITCASKYSLRYYHSEKAKEYRLKNSDKIIKYQHEYDKKYRQKNSEKIKTRKKEYYENYYKEARRDKMNEYEKERRKNDPIYRLNHNISIAIWRSLKNGKGNNHWESLVDYSFMNLKKHLEAQFQDEMTWENYGRNGWHIDHIIPISLFNIKTFKSKGFKKCWSLENLRPMWARENIIKSNKLFVS